VQSACAAAGPVGPSSASASSGARPPVRRRTSGPRQVFKREPTGQQTPNVTSRVAQGPAPERHPAPQAWHASQANPAPAADGCDLMIDPADYALRPQPTGTARPTTHLVVNARYVDDIPKPPPKT